MWPHPSADAAAPQHLLGCAHTDADSEPDAARDVSLPPAPVEVHSRGSARNGLFEWRGMLRPGSGWWQPQCLLPVPQAVGREALRTNVGRFLRAVCWSGQEGGHSSGRRRPRHHFNHHHRLLCREKEEREKAKPGAGTQGTRRPDEWQCLTAPHEGGDAHGSRTDRPERHGKDTGNQGMTLPRQTSHQGRRRRRGGGDGEHTDSHLPHRHGARALQNDRGNLRLTSTAWVVFSARVLVRSFNDTVDVVLVFIILRRVVFFICAYFESSLFSSQKPKMPRRVCTCACLCWGRRRFHTAAVLLAWIHCGSVQKKTPCGVCCWCQNGGHLQSLCFALRQCYCCRKQLASTISAIS